MNSGFSPHFSGPQPVIATVYRDVPRVWSLIALLFVVFNAISIPVRWSLGFLGGSLWPKRNLNRDVNEQT